MDEKRLKREVLILLGTAFAVFSTLFFIIGSFMVLSTVEDAKNREYFIVGECFKYVIDLSMEEVLGVALHVSYDVDEYLEKGQEDLIGSLKKNVEEVQGVTGFHVFDRFGKIIYSSGDLSSSISGFALKVMRSKEPLATLLDSGGDVLVASGAPLKAGGIVVLTKDLKGVMERARKTLGGKFNVERWTDLPEDVIERMDQNGDVLIDRFRDRTEVFFRIETRYGKTDYYLHWVEPSGRSSIVLKVLGFIVLFFLPMFGVVFLMINFLRRKIFKNFIEPLEKMVEVLDDIVASTSSSSQELAASSQELAANTRNLEEKGAELSRLSSDMLGDLEKTSDFADSVSEFARFLKRALENLAEINSSLMEVMKSIHRLGGVIQQIGERIVVLSINASIEGSRENIDREAIKALAEEIAQLSETTTQQVTEIFTSIQESQDRLDDMDRAVKGIMLETEKLESSSQKLRDMIKTNRGEFEKITDNVQSMFTSIEEINFASQNLAEAATELSRKAYEVQKVIDEFMVERSKKEEGGKGDV